jgi:hypothetical protein
MMRRVSYLLEHYFATISLATIAWVTGTAAFALAVNFNVGLALMLAPAAILVVGAIVGYLIEESIHEIRGQR